MASPCLRGLTRSRSDTSSILAAAFKLPFARRTCGSKDPSVLKEQRRWLQRDSGLKSADEKREKEYQAAIKKIKKASAGMFCVGLPASLPSCLCISQQQGFNYEAQVNTHVRARTRTYTLVTSIPHLFNTVPHSSAD